MFIVIDHNDYTKGRTSAISGQRWVMIYVWLAAAANLQPKCILIVLSNSQVIVQPHQTLAHPLLPSHKDM